MNSKKNILILTTLNDISIAHFFSNKIRKIFDVDVFLIEDFNSSFGRLSRRYDFVYIRDPFTDRNFQDYKAISSAMDKVYEKYPSAYYVDKVKDMDGALIEDKLRQYALFSEFMPKTRELKKGEGVDFESYFVKKRVSSRSEGIVFFGDALQPGEDYIIQDKLDIEEEYRVFSVGSRILEKSLVRSSKTSASTALKTLDAVATPEKVKTFVKKLIDVLELDFVGYDIARDKNGKLWLLEMNRSPQFQSYYAKTGENLAEVLADHLLKR